MSKLKNNPIGIYEKAIPNMYDWATKIKIAKEAGYDFIEMSIDETDERLFNLEWSKEMRGYVRNLLFDNDIYINSICLSAHRRFPFGSNNEQTRQKAYKIMDKAIILAKDLGVRNIQLAGYDVYYEDSNEETKSRFIEGLKYAAKKASSANVILSIEIMDTEFIGTITRCMEYISAVDSPWLQIYPDFGNLSQWTDTPEMELELGKNHIVGIHLKDTKPGVFKCVPFGEGTVNFSKLFNKIDELELQCPFLVEMWADNTVENTYAQSVEHIKKAKDWLIDKAGERFSE